MKRFFPTAFAVAAIAVLVAACETTGSTSTPPTRERVEFCKLQDYTCRVTCPRGGQSCFPECDRRLDACQKSGCYHFNVPGPQCELGAKK